MDQLIHTQKAALIILSLQLLNFTSAGQVDVPAASGSSYGGSSSLGSGTSVSMLPGVNSDVDPDFTGPIENVTVAVGREAVLSCSVTELGHYKVGWMKAEDQTILTLHTRVVTHNSRISVTHDNLRTWQLRIRQLKESDRGCYMCQINTSTMKKQLGCVDVHVPPDIIDNETSGDITVTEGDNATLVCRATGHPQPRILWRREDGDHLVIRKGREVLRVDTFSGDTLTLLKLDRKQMGAYLCIASNDVPPAVSKRILLNVNFAPSIKVPNQLLGAPLGTEVLLECFVEAFPNTINYWVKNRGEILIQGKKHMIMEKREGYKVLVQLTIHNFSKRDLGIYTCVSTNSLGRADGVIRLYEIKVPTKPPPTTEPPVITMASIEMSSKSSELQFEQRSMIPASTLASLDSLIDDPVVMMDNSISPSVATIPREYSANYASTSSASGILSNVHATTLLSILIAALLLR